MHAYSRYFPTRSDDDQLDIITQLRRGLAGRADRRLLVFDDEVWTVGGMSATVADMQAMLAAHGVRTGDRVLVMLKNDPLHIALIYAVMLSGAVWVPVNTRLKSAGIAYQLGHSKPRLAIVDEDFRKEFDAALAGQAQSCAVIGVAELRAVPKSGAQPVGADVAPSDPVCIIYTSGTTGAPKGVVFTHRMMRIASEAVLIVAAARDGDRLFLWEPLCHIGGAQMLMVPFLVQAELYAVTAFSASRFWRQVAAGRCTQLHYLGGILDILMRLPKDPLEASHSLRVAWGAGVAPSSWADVRRRLGVELRECYGMTECSSFATVNESDKPGSIGRPFPWLELELLDDEDRPVPAGELGQIVLSSEVEGVFLPGYLDNPEATAQALRGGRLYTGDMARRDEDGDLFFVGRRTDSMRVRGENVSAWEVERVMLDHPAVAAAAALGVQSEIGEQEILLYVQWQPGSSPDFAGLSQWAGERLAAFQWPRYYLSIAQFELTPSQRIRKHLLSKDVAGAWDRRQVA